MLRSRVFVSGTNTFCTLTFLQETFWREVCNEQLLRYWPRCKDLARLQSLQRRPAWKISKSSTESNVLRHVGWQRDRCKDLQEFRTASQTGMRRPVDFIAESARHRHTEYSQVYFIFIGLFITYLQVPCLCLRSVHNNHAVIVPFIYAQCKSSFDIAVDLDCSPSSEQQSGSSCTSFNRHAWHTSLAELSSTCHT